MYVLLQRRAQKCETCHGLAPPAAAKQNHHFTAAVLSIRPARIYETVISRRDPPNLPCVKKKNRFPRRASFSKSSLSLSSPFQQLFLGYHLAVVKGWWSTISTFFERTLGCAFGKNHMKRKPHHTWTHIKKSHEKKWHHTWTHLFEGFRVKVR